MAWFAGSNWSQLKGQLTNMTKELLTETTQETDDPETELAVAKSRLQTIEAQNAALRSELDNIITRFQAAELQASEDAIRLKQSEDQVRKLTAQLESASEMHSTKVQTTKPFSAFAIPNDDVPLETTVESADHDDWHQHHQVAAVVGDDALEQARAEAEYWRMIASSNQSISHSPNDSQHGRTSNELILQLKECEKQLGEERVRHELEVVAIRELYERRLAETAESQSFKSTTPPVDSSDAASNTPCHTFQDAGFQTESIPIPVESNPEKEQVVQFDKGISTDENAPITTETGCNTLQTAALIFELQTKRRLTIDQLQNDIVGALNADDLASLSRHLLAAGQSALLLEVDGEVFPHDCSSKIACTGAVWQATTVTHNEASTSTGNDFAPKILHANTQTERSTSSCEVQCDPIRPEASAVAPEPTLDSVSTKPTSESFSQTDLAFDEREAVITKLESDIASLTAERDHFSAAAHQQHGEAIRLFSEMERWRAEVDRLRSHLMQMENDYTAAAVASEQREKELRDKLAATSESGPNLENAVREKNLLASKLKSAESEQHRLAKQISALQTALDQLQQNAEDQFSIEREKLQKEVKQLRKDLDGARLRAAESSMNIEKMRQLTEKLTSSEQSVSRLKCELDRISAERMNAATQVSELKATLSDCIERRIMKGLIAACLHAPPGQRQLEALNMVAKVVGVSEQEMKQAASQVEAARRGSSSNASGGLGEMFVKFLEAESAENMAANLRLSLAPAASTGTPQPSSPSPASLFGRWPFTTPPAQQTPSIPKSSETSQLPSHEPTSSEISKS